MNFDKDIVCVVFANFKQNRAIYLNSLANSSNAFGHKMRYNQDIKQISVTARYDNDTGAAKA